MRGEERKGRVLRGRRKGSHRCRRWKEGLKDARKGLRGEKGYRIVREKRRRGEREEREGARGERVVTGARVGSSYQPPLI